MSLTTKIMFIRQLEPVSNLEVRSPTSDPTKILKTDAEGRVSLVIAPGQHVVEIFEQGRWVSHSFVRRHDSELIVVDLEPTLTSSTTQHKLKQQLYALGDRYRFDRVLGRGGMGVVIKAHDHVLDREVAIKMLNEQWQDNEIAQKLFFEEARHLASLKHPNLVAVHDVTTLEGIVVMVMEFVQGLPLDVFLEEHGKLDPIMLRQVSGQLGAALSYLHHQGVIHRDIKPGNMLWREDETLKIVDFGLARSLEQLNIRGTQIRGTPAYMAPEQLLGRPLNYATDLYQVGVTLFELASGQLPFDERNIASDHIQTEAPSIKSVVPTIEDELAKLIDQSLLKEPQRRPESAASFAQLIEVHHEDAMLRPTHEVMISALSHTPQGDSWPLLELPKPTRRLPLAPLAMIASVLIGLGLLAIWSWPAPAELAPLAASAPADPVAASSVEVSAPSQAEEPGLGQEHKAALAQSLIKTQVAYELARRIAAAEPPPKPRTVLVPTRAPKAAPKPPEVTSPPSPKPDLDAAPAPTPAAAPPKTPPAPRPEVKLLPSPKDPPPSKAPPKLADIDDPKAPVKPAPATPKAPVPRSF